MLGFPQRLYSVGEIPSNARNAREKLCTVAKPQRVAICDKVRFPPAMRLFAWRILLRQRNSLGEQPKCRANSLRKWLFERLQQAASSSTLASGLFFTISAACSKDIACSS